VPEGSDRARDVAVSAVTALLPGLPLFWSSAAPSGPGRGGDGKRP
jgi:hypothetical protein